MRKIAFLKNFYKENFTTEKLKATQYYVSRDGVDLPKFNKVLQTYFVIGSKPKRKIISFLHKSFEEYLLAENYIEGIIKGKKSSFMNCRTGNTSSIIDFIDGFISLQMNETFLSVLERDNPKVKKAFDNLVESFDIQSKEYILEQLKHKSYELFISKNIYDMDIDCESTDLVHKELLRKEILPTFGNIWDYRWVSLYFYLALTKDNYSERLINGQEIFELFKTNGNETEFIEDLRFIDFKKIRAPSLFLTHVDLSQTTFTNCILIGLNMWGCKLNDSKVFDSNLSGSNFVGWYIDNIFGTYSTALNGAYFSDTQLSNSNISRLMTHGTSFIKCDLSYSNLSNSSLDHVVFLDSKLSHCNLSNTRCTKTLIFFTTINDLDIRNTSFTDCLLLSTDTYFNFLVDDKVTFTNTKTDNSYLIQYLIENGCKSPLSK